MKNNPAILISYQEMCLDSFLNSVSLALLVSVLAMLSWKRLFARGLRVSSLASCLFRVSWLDLRKVRKSTYDSCAELSCFVFFFSLRDLISSSSLR
jgi:hypothetical protein